MVYLGLFAFLERCGSCLTAYYLSIVGVLTPTLRLGQLCLSKTLPPFFNDGDHAPFAPEF
jgi:hypothetical protein